jgi:pyrroloquinoline quinone biosynthesis protein B
VPRSQSSAAISSDGERWFLLNASPDVREQLERLAVRQPEGARHVPVEGIVLTDAELDHTLGIVLLREARQLQIAATDTVRRVIEDDSRLLPVTRAFADVRVSELHPDRPTHLCYRDGEASGLRVTCFPVPAGPPRFARTDGPNHTVGLIVEDERTAGACAFVPGSGGLDAELLGRLAAADRVLFDGTFGTDRELIELGIGERSAREMDHLPVSGPDGSLARLRTLSGRQRVYTHINNTNPMLIETGPERREVEQAGVQIGVDGMRFTL